MFNKEIKFIITDNALEDIVPHPQPASHFIPEEYKKCDDIWLSGFLTAQKIKKYIVPCRLLSYEKYEEEIKQLWTNRPTRPPRWRDKLPHPHVRYVDHVFAINGGKYEKEDTYKNIVEYLKNE